MNLLRLKELLVETLDELNNAEESPANPPVGSDPEYVVEFDLAGNPKMPPAFDGCSSMREAAQRAGLFNVHAYIGDGIQQGAAQMYQHLALDHVALETAIRALGRGAWGRGWLARLENRAVTAPGYVRMFGFKPVERKRDGSLVEVA
jgi:hypothetical protein